MFVHKLSNRTEINHRKWQTRKVKLAEAYASMIVALGGYCGASCDPELGCGTRSNLQLHHKNGRPWIASRVGPLKRSRLYAEDFARGELGVLCRQCNELDGVKHRYVYKAKHEAAPF